MKNIKHFWKEILITTGLTVMFGGGMMMGGESFLGGEAEDITHIQDTVATSQATYFAENGKYEHTASSTYNSLDYYCYEYMNAISQPGYQLFIEKGSGTSTEIMSTGYGPEATSRTWEWRLKYQDE